MDDTTVVNSSPASAKEKLVVSPNVGKSTIKFTGHSSIQKKSVSAEDRKLATQTRLLLNELSRQKASYKRHIDQLEQAIKIVKSFEKEERVLELIAKWRGVSQAGMSYMLNSTLLKIDKMGGYEELLRRECEAEKRKIEYGFNDSLEQEMEAIFESEDFQALSEEIQQEYKDQINERLKDAQTQKEKALVAVESRMKQNAGQEMSMQELSKRMKMDYSLIFPE